MSDRAVRVDPSGSPTVNYEDVDDIIGEAARIKQATEEKLTVEDLKGVAAELDIPAHYVERAMTELARRKAERAARLARRRTLALRIAAVAAIVAALFGVAAASGQNALRAANGQVEQRRAQVVNVLQRQARVAERLRDAPPSVDRDVELSGAENRVAIERRRYDQAASEYNARAGAFPGSIWRALAGLPRRAPLSNEVAQW